jgi:hypothetical protein
VKAVERAGGRTGGGEKAVASGGRKMAFVTDPDSYEVEILER